MNADLKVMQLIQKSDLPAGVPPVPRNYLVFADAANAIFTRAPVDKRKNRGRVPAEPMIFELRCNEQMTEFEWLQCGETRETIPIRNKMIWFGLKSEILFNMKMTAKAPKCSTMLRQEYGMQGTPVSLYMQFSRFMGYTPDTKIAAMALAEGELA